MCFVIKTVENEMCAKCDMFSIYVTEDRKVYCVSMLDFGHRHQFPILLHFFTGIEV